MRCRAGGPHAVRTEDTDPKGVLMATATSNRIRLVHSALTVAASAIAMGWGGAASAATHAATVGQPPTEWAENAGSWPAQNYALSNTPRTTRTPLNPPTVPKLNE